MKEILDKYKEICQVLFVEGIDDEVLIAKVHRKIDSSINILTSIFDSEQLIIDDLYTVLDIMSSTICISISLLKLSFSLIMKILV